MDDDGIDDRGASPLHVIDRCLKYLDDLSVGGVALVRLPQYADARPFQSVALESGRVVGKRRRWRSQV